MSIVIANSNPVHIEIEKELSAKYGATILHSKEELNESVLSELKPDYIFFLHWSFIIPKEIFGNYNCVVFHMTDLPYGRGGSPLQNLIVRGHSDTVLSAIKVAQGIDTGPVYLKRKLDLSGTATEIFKRAGVVMKDMIHEIVTSRPAPVEQQGEAVIFKRRTPAESNIEELNDIGKVYDFIRMLDAEGYPNAFIETNNLRFEFTGAKLNGGEITANVKITPKK